MVGWHCGLDGHEFEQALGLREGQGSQACYIPWGRKESDTTEQRNNNNLFAGKEWRHSDREWTCGKVGEEKTGMDGESSIDIYIYIYTTFVKQTAGEKLLYNTENPDRWLCDDLKE